MAVQLSLTRHKVLSGGHTEMPTVIGNSSGSPVAGDYEQAAGKGCGRVKTSREARWGHLHSYISNQLADGPELF